MTTRRSRPSTLSAAVLALVTSMLVLAAPPAPAHAYPRPGVTERVSVASDGTEGDAPAANNPPSISADGRFVAFASFASTLVPGGTSGEHEDIFVHDRSTGDTEQVSVASDGTQGDGASWWPSISADGRFVAFASAATNLVPGDTNARWDVFVHDRATRSTERVSVTSDGEQGVHSSWWSSISADGSAVAFVSAAANLVAGDTNGRQDIYVHLRSTGVTRRVSVASDGAQSNGHSGGPAVSGDGRFTAFYSSASNLVPNDTSSGSEDVFLHDLATGATERISVTSDEGEVGGLGNNTWTPSITPDGRYVAFTHSAGNLVTGDNAVHWDIFVRDRLAGTTERVSVASTGVQGNGNSNGPSISADGRYVAFDSYASNLVPEDGNSMSDIFVHDRAIGATERVSTASDGTEGEGSSWPPSIAADGRIVAFNSIASSLVAGDRNGGRDVFVRERGSPRGVVGDLTVTRVEGGVRVAGLATLSGEVTTASADPADDARAAQAAAGAGAELTGASLTYRPEQEDHLLRWRLSSLPRGPLVTGAVGGGLPAVLYGFELRLGATRFEVRALREGLTADAPRLPYAALFRCAPSCEEEAPLEVGFGTAKGDEVWVSLPMEVLGAATGDQLSSIRAFTAAGEAATGAVQELDDVALSATTVPAATLELGIAPGSTPEHEVVFEHRAEIAAGAFAADVATGSPDGGLRVWARSCLAASCGPAASAEVPA